MQFLIQLYNKFLQQQGLQGDKKEIKRKKQSPSGLFFTVPIILSFPSVKEAPNIKDSKKQQIRDPMIISVTVIYKDGSYNKRWHSQVNPHSYFFVFKAKFETLIHLLHPRLVKTVFT